VDLDHTVKIFLEAVLRKIFESHMKRAGLTTRSFLLIMTYTRKENDIVCRDLCLNGMLASA